MPGVLGGEVQFVLGVRERLDGASDRVARLVGFVGALFEGGLRLTCLVGLQFGRLSRASTRPAARSSSCCLPS